MTMALLDRVGRDHAHSLFRPLGLERLRPPLLLDPDIRHEHKRRMEKRLNNSSWMHKVFLIVTVIVTQLFSFAPIVNLIQWVLISIGIWFFYGLTNEISSPNKSHPWLWWKQLRDPRISIDRLHWSFILLWSVICVGYCMFPEIPSHVQPSAANNSPSPLIDIRKHANPYHPSHSLDPSFIAISNKGWHVGVGFIGILSVQTPPIPHANPQVVAAFFNPNGNDTMMDVTSTQFNYYQNRDWHVRRLPASYQSEPSAGTSRPLAQSRLHHWFSNASGCLPGTKTEYSNLSLEEDRLNSYLQKMQGTDMVKQKKTIHQLDSGKAECSSHSHSQRGIGISSIYDDGSSHHTDSSFPRLVVMERSRPALPSADRLLTDTLEKSSGGFTVNMWNCIMFCLAVKTAINNYATGMNLISERSARTWSDLLSTLLTCTKPSQKKFIQSHLLPLCVWIVVTELHHPHPLLWKMAMFHLITVMGHLVLGLVSSHRNLCLTVGSMFLVGFSVGMIPSVSQMAATKLLMPLGTSVIRTATDASSMGISGFLQTFPSSVFLPSSNNPFEFRNETIWTFSESKGAWMSWMKSHFQLPFHFISSRGMRTILDVSLDKQIVFGLAFALLVYLSSWDFQTQNQWYTRFGTWSTFDCNFPLSGRVNGRVSNGQKLKWMVWIALMIGLGWLLGIWSVYTETYLSGPMSFFLMVWIANVLFSDKSKIPFVNAAALVDFNRSLFDDIKVVNENWDRFYHLPVRKLTESEYNKTLLETVYQCSSLDRPVCSIICDYVQPRIACLRCDPILSHTENNLEWRPVDTQRIARFRAYTFSHLRSQKKDQDYLASSPFICRNNSLLTEQRTRAKHADLHQQGQNTPFPFSMTGDTERFELCSQGQALYFILPFTGPSDFHLNYNNYANWFNAIWEHFQSSTSTMSRNPQFTTNCHTFSSVPVSLSSNLNAETSRGQRDHAHSSSRRLEGEWSALNRASPSLAETKFSNKDRVGKAELFARGPRENKEDSLLKPNIGRSHSIKARIKSCWKCQNFLPSHVSGPLLLQCPNCDASLGYEMFGKLWQETDIGNIKHYWADNAGFFLYPPLRGLASPRRGDVYPHPGRIEFAHIFAHKQAMFLDQTMVSPENTLFLRYFLRNHSFEMEQNLVSPKLILQMQSKSSLCYQFHASQTRMSSTGLSSSRPRPLNSNENHNDDDGDLFYNDQATKNGVHETFPVYMGAHMLPSALWCGFSPNSKSFQDSTSYTNHHDSKIRVAMDMPSSHLGTQGIGRHADPYSNTCTMNCSMDHGIEEMSTQCQTPPANFKSYGVAFRIIFEVSRSGQYRNDMYFLRDPDFPALGAQRCACTQWVYCGDSV